jgi:hypothetical protein
MRSIFFNVRPHVGHEGQQSLLQRLADLPGVDRAVALSPHAKNPVTRRMYYAYVDDDADIERVRQQIAGQPEVESADLPAERGLAGGAAEA